MLGPYEQSNGWRVVVIDDDGKRSSSVYPTEQAAQIYRDALVAELERSDQTTETALVEYRKHLAAKGNKADSIRQTAWIIGLMFPEPVHLASLTPKRCAAAYVRLRTEPMPRTGKPPSVDTHRSALAQSATFLDWCASEGYMRGANPFADVQGIGKRRPRGMVCWRYSSLIASTARRFARSLAWFRTATFRTSQQRRPRLRSGAISGGEGCPARCAIRCDGDARLLELRRAALLPRADRAPTGLLPRLRRRARDHAAVRSARRRARIGAAPPDWMPRCATCARTVRGLAVRDDHDARVYEAHCHDERAQLHVAFSELVVVPWTDAEAYLQRRVAEWSPFPVGS